MTPTVYLKIALSLTCLTLVKSECTVKLKSDYKDVLLKKISVLDDLHAEYGGFTYHVSICPKSSNTPLFAGATRRKVPLNQTTVIGRYNDSDIVGKDDWVLLTYGSGDKILSNSSCNGISWKTLIFIKCEPKTDEVLEVLEPLSSSSCMTMILVRTTLLCPEETGWSGLSVFFTLFFVILSLYFLTMIGYRRFILGAKGYEQVPHYNLIQSILSLPMAFIRKVLAGNSSPRTPPPQPINPDPADEPLLSP